MTSTILRTVPCAICGHRIGTDAGQCPYCGIVPRQKAKRPATATVAHAVGRCAMCGGRFARRRGLVDRMLVRLRLRAPHRSERVTCSTCGHLERSR